MIKAGSLAVQLRKPSFPVHPTGQKEHSRNSALNRGVGCPLSILTFPLIV